MNAPAWNFPWMYPSSMPLSPVGTVSPAAYTDYTQFGLSAAAPSMGMSASSADIARSLAGYGTPAGARQTGPLISAPAAAGQGGTLGMAPGSTAPATGAGTVPPTDPNMPNPTLGYIGAGIQGIGMLGQLGLGAYGLYQGAQAFNFQKSMALKNFENQRQSYNTNMEDRIRARHSSSSRMSQEDIDAEVNKRLLKK